MEIQACESNVVTERKYCDFSIFYGVLFLTSLEDGFELVKQR